MLDEARHWAEPRFGTAALGDARRTHRLVSTMAAIARAPDESLPRQLGSLAETKAGSRLFDCGAVPRTPIMDPHVAQCRAAAARHPIVLMVHDDTILDFSLHRTLKGAGRVGDDRGTGFLAHSCLNRVYFEKRSFSSSGSRVSLTQRRSAMTKGSRFRRPSKSAARWVRSSALAWQW